jgi:hypothetical protein
MANHLSTLVSPRPVRSPIRPKPHREAHQWSGHTESSRRATQGDLDKSDNMPSTGGNASLGSCLPSSPQYSEYVSKLTRLYGERTDLRGVSRLGDAFFDGVAQ